jgi:Na+/melibiose symporter-like transporter
VIVFSVVFVALGVILLAVAVSPIVARLPHVALGRVTAALLGTLCIVLAAMVIASESGETVRAVAYVIGGVTTGAASASMGLYTLRLAPSAYARANPDHASPIAEQSTKAIFRLSAFLFFALAVIIPAAMIGDEIF